MGRGWKDQNSETQTCMLQVSYGISEARWGRWVLQALENLQTRLSCSCSYRKALLLPTGSSLAREMLLATGWRGAHQKWKRKFFLPLQPCGSLQRPLWSLPGSSGKQKGHWLSQPLPPKAQHRGTGMELIKTSRPNSFNEICLFSFDFQIGNQIIYLYLTCIDDLGHVNKLTRMEYLLHAKECDDLVHEISTI